MVAWMVLAGALGIVWVGRYFLVGAVAGRRAVLGSTSHAPPAGGWADAPMISVIVAAKDEEANIESCITSLLAQDYPNFEVIAVDDRSDDATPAILRRLEQGANGRLRVVTVQTRREGWFGKNNAMREGVAVASGEWFLLTDADCRFTARNALTVTMLEAQAHDAGFLSVVPILETPTAWERIVQPVCALVLILWFLPEKVNDPDKKAAYANGAFMLMSRRCYDAIGGHERVRAELNEDIRMARFAKRGGLNLRVTENDDLYVTRMYDTPRAAFNGWSRIFFGSLQTTRRLLISAGLLVLFSITPWVSLAVAAIGSLTVDAQHATHWRWMLYAWLGVVVCEQATTLLVYRMMRARPLWSLTYILGALAALAMLVSAMFKAVGATGTTWRGTTYHGDQPAAETSASQADIAVSPSVEEPAANA